MRDAKLIGNESAQKLAGDEISLMRDFGGFLGRIPVGPSETKCLQGHAIMDWRRWDHLAGLSGVETDCGLNGKR